MFFLCMRNQVYEKWKARFRHNAKELQLHFLLS